jgi:hypothetical protein
VIGAAYLVTMLLTSLRNWFAVPTTGLTLANLLYLTGALLSLV